MVPLQLPQARILGGVPGGIPRGIPSGIPGGVPGGISRDGVPGGVPGGIPGGVPGGKALSPLPTTRTVSVLSLPSSRSLQGHLSP